MSQIFKNFRPKENSKNQKTKENKKIKVIGCNRCHQTGVTLRKGKDSYYCEDCFNIIQKKNKKKGDK